MAYARKNIAKYALPYDIEFRAELPKTLVGKVAYRVLEEEELKKLAAAVPDAGDRRRKVSGARRIPRHTNRQSKRPADFSAGALPVFSASERLYRPPEAGRRGSILSGNLGKGCKAGLQLRVGGDVVASSRRR